MEEFIQNMAEYAPVKDEFTKILQVEVEEDDRDAILQADERKRSQWANS